MYRKYQLESRRTLRATSDVTQYFSHRKTDERVKDSYELTRIHCYDVITDDSSEISAKERYSEALDMEQVASLKEECLKNLKTIAAKVDNDKCVMVREDSVKDVQYICSLYNAFENKMSQTELQNFRQDVAKVITETSILKYLTKLIVTYPADVYCNIASYEDMYLLYLTMSLLLSFTGESDALTAAVVDTAVTKFCKALLEKCAEGHLVRKLSELLEKILHTTISLLHRLSMNEASVKQLRHLGFTNTLQRYLKSPDEEVSLTSMAVLANIVTEEEFGIVAENAHLVAKLLYFLQKGMEKESHIYEGWSTKKCGLAVRNLAKNDANKKLLWKLNAIETLADLTQTGDEDEQLESVRAIWALCFDEDIRKDVLNDKESRVITLLQQLEKSTANEEIKDACAKCLWTLRRNVKRSSETSAPQSSAPQSGLKSSESTMLPRSKSNVSKGHIMISYQSHDRQVLLEIKHILEEKNYKVWMDVDKMGGSTLQAMAEAVENAIVVLLCYSRKYKESDNTRLEAEYVHEQRKPFIPLKMERGYKPDGWLGLLIGSKYFVDFSGKYKFEDKLVDLFRELDRILEPDPEETNAPPPTVGAVENKEQILLKPVSDNTSTSQVLKKDENSESLDNSKGSKMQKLEQIRQIRKWSKADVLNWLKKHSLRNHGLDDLTGEEVSFLARLMLEAPDKIYDLLTKDLKVNALLLKSRIVWALDDLSLL